MYGSTVFDQSTVSGKLSRAGTAILGQLSVKVKYEVIRLMISTMQLLCERRDLLEVRRSLNESDPRGKVSAGGKTDCSQQRFGYARHDGISGPGRSAMHRPCS